jgi:hypothetical protein
MLGVLSASAHGHRCSQLLLRGRRSDACRLGGCVTGLAVRTRLPPTARLTKIGLDPYRKMKINGQEPYNSQTKTSGWEPNRSIAVRTLDRAGREIEPSAQAMSSRRDLSTPKSESRLPCYGEAVLHDDFAKLDKFLVPSPVPGLAEVLVGSWSEERRRRANNLWRGAIGTAVEVSAASRASKRSMVPCEDLAGRRSQSLRYSCWFRTPSRYRACCFFQAEPGRNVP